MWKDRCAEVTSRAAEKASRGPPEGSRRSGTARLVGAIGNVDAGVCHWFIRSFFLGRKAIWYCDVAGVCSSAIYRVQRPLVMPTTWLLSLSLCTKNMA